MKEILSLTVFGNILKCSHLTFLIFKSREIFLEESVY